MNWWSDGMAKNYKLRICIMIRLMSKIYAKTAQRVIYKRLNIYLSNIFILILLCRLALQVCQATFVAPEEASAKKQRKRRAKWDKRAERVLYWIWQDQKKILYTQSGCVRVIFWFWFYKCYSNFPACLVMIRETRKKLFHFYWFPKPKSLEISHQLN